MKKEHIYDLVANFLELLSKKNFNKLNTDFNLTYPIYEEIFEELENNSLENETLTLADKEMALNNLNENRAVFEVYSMNNKDEYGVECAIFANKKITDLTLEGNVFQREDKIEFRYKLIRS
ncbi:hypothetical protein [Faucicola atlantae]|jgi:hypothetical protein|uniref:hypothetical protein n=1 Tax=Faucicola atlantae TaxID=34059 RepID=UPI0025AF5119|nr:hypothetical protein [Moraxella atlantae]